MRIIALTLLCFLMAASPLRADQVVFRWVGEWHPLDVRTHEPTLLGDVNADGHDDLLLLSEEPLVFFGGPSADSQVDRTLQLREGFLAERAAQGPFDFNGDGVADVVLGVPSADIGEMTQAGAVVCYWGSTDLSPEPSFQIDGPWTRYFFGSSVVRAPRFLEGDVVDDLAVTISTAYGWGPSPSVYVYPGGDPPGVTDEWGRTELLHYSSWEFNFAAAGDFDGDGHGDLVTGSPREDGFICQDPDAPGEWIFECPEAGKVYLYRGGPDMWSTARVLFGTHPHQALGESVFGGIDLNGDGRSEVLATSEVTDETLVLLGHENPPLSTFEADLYVVGGADACGIGDADGDGLDDLATLDQSGAIWVYRGDSAAGLKEGTIVRNEDEHLQRVGISRIGDFDGDGRDDLAVSSVDSGFGEEDPLLVVEIWSARRLAVSIAELPDDTSPSPPRQASLSLSPNPFNPTVSVAYELPSDCFVEIDVVALDGRHVATLFRGAKSTGAHVAAWDGTDATGTRVSSGVYFFVLRTPERRLAARGALLK